MALYREYHVRMADMIADKAGVVVADVTTVDLNDVSTADTWTLTPTRVDTGDANAATEAVTWNATNATNASGMQTAIRALGGIYADATVAAGAAETYVITVNGGYDVTWEVTDATTFTPGASTETTPGSVTYTGQLPIGRFGIVKRLRLEEFNDASLDVSLVDELSKNVFVKTAIDTSTTSVDTPYDKYLACDGVAGEDGAAAANPASGLFEGPLAVTVVTSSPDTTGQITVFVQNGRTSCLKYRSSGTFTAGTASIPLGGQLGNIKRIRLDSVTDTSVAPVITDAYGKNVYTKSSTDYSTAVCENLSHEGVDQAANALADTLDVIAKSPLTVTLTGHDGTGFKVDVWVVI